LSWWQFSICSSSSDGSCSDGNAASSSDPTESFVSASPLHRWIFPLGLVGLAALFGATWALPPATGAIFFPLARIVYTAAYLGLLAIGFRHKRRRLTVEVGPAGITAAGELVVARDDIRQVLRTDAAIELRGRRPLAVETASPAEAQAFVALLDPRHDTDPLTFLATVTPLYVIILCWMGIPAATAFALQPLLMAHADRATLLSLLVPAIAVWLTTSVWCMRRRRFTITQTELHLPRWWTTTDRVVDRAALAGVRAIDPFTLELRFHRGRPCRFKLYDPSMISELRARLPAASGLSPAG
jgi:hypothetical protein